LITGDENQNQNLIYYGNILKNSNEKLSKEDKSNYL